MQTVRYCRNMALGLSAAAALVCSAANAAPFPEQNSPDVVKAAAPTIAHHKFSLGSNAHQTIKLPVSSEPIQMLLSLSSGNGGTGNPSELAYAVLNQDSVSGDVTWIGTSSNGTTEAGTTQGSGYIATVGSAIITALARTTGAPNGSLVITQSSTIGKVHYIVTLTYFSAK
jgi:hypothetical protein